MKLPDRLDIPLKRLAAALDHLEAAAERRSESAARRADLEEELAVMQDDRARLGIELEGALARARKLEEANALVAEKLVATSTTIRHVLGLPTPPEQGEV
jgi:chromosome segregation ATPase